MRGTGKAGHNQLDLFNGQAPPAARAPASAGKVSPLSAHAALAKKVVVAAPPRSVPAPKPQVAPAPYDEWWTTRMVCAFLKISRKTLWERRRDKSLDFPKPANLGGGRNVYRASAVRAWADDRASAEDCALG